MRRLDLVSYFIGGAFLANAVPHFVSGVMGRPFQSPFAKRPGEGLSPASVNVLWAYINIVVGYVLVFRIGDFESKNTSHIVALVLGSLLASLVLARRFGRVRGGNVTGE